MMIRGPDISVIVRRQKTNRDQVSKVLMPLRRQAKRKNAAVRYQYVRASIWLWGRNIPSEPISIPIPFIPDIPDMLDMLDMLDISDVSIVSFLESSSARVLSKSEEYSARS